MWGCARYGGVGWLAAAPFIAIVALSTVLGGALHAQELLPCGVPMIEPLATGELKRFRFSTPAGATVVLQSSDISGTIGLLRLRAFGPGVPEGAAETCSGVLSFVSDGGATVLEVSDCFGNNAGNYTVTLNVVSDTLANCGRPLECGWTPDGLGLGVRGEVDSFVFFFASDEEGTDQGRHDEKDEPDVRLRLTDFDGSVGLLRVRIFDPDGEPVEQGDTCGRNKEIGRIIELRLPNKTGMYTVLLSSCGLPTQGRYRLWFHDDTCPTGPDITYFGITTSDNTRLLPIGVDRAGRPVYFRSLGSGLGLVVEAGFGANRRPPGLRTVAEDIPPEMEMIVSNNMGNGAPAVCDISPPDIGGVPATEPLVFSTDAMTLDAVNDLGCRFNDGQGNPLGRADNLDACTKSNEGFGFGFVDPATTVQFCGFIASAWALPAGKTTVFRARVRDEMGVPGAVREIAVQIGAPFTPTPTFTRTPSVTRTPARTRTSTRTGTSTRTPTPTQIGTRTYTPTVGLTPTATDTVTGTQPPTATPTVRMTDTPSPTPSIEPTSTVTSAPTACAGDCNGDRTVTVSEISRAVGINLGNNDVAVCPAADPNRNGEVEVGELVQAVRNTLLGCPGVAGTAITDSRR